MNLDLIERYYEISKEGKIISKRTNRELKYWLSPSKCGYPTIMLYLGDKKLKISIHRLVAMKYLDNKNNFNYVNHIDGNKLNNDVSNLEWCTAKQNTEHLMNILGYDMGRIKVIKKDLDNNIIKTYNSIKEASDDTGIEYSSLAKCVRGKYKLSGGYRWERATTSREA